MNYEILDIDSVEQLNDFEEEYVYDIEMDSDTEHTFFANDILVHNSLMVSISDVLRDELAKNGKVTDSAYQVIEELGNYLNDNIKRWAKRSLNCLNCTLEFKREIISDYSLFLKKKHYVMHVLDKEGIKKEDWKYTGVEIVTTKMPKDVKPYVEKIIHNIVLTASEESTNLLLTEAYKQFDNLALEEISLPSGINNYIKYAQKAEGFNTGKGTPKHVKAAIFYNNLIHELGIDDKYEEIRSGDKIRLLEVKSPNRYNIPVLAYKYKYPKEFLDIFKIDKEIMFEKCMFKCIERFYKAMGWAPRKPNDMFLGDVEEFFI